MFNNPSAPKLLAACCSASFLTSSAAFADYITVEMNFNNKVFVVVRTAFTHENIFKLFTGILLDNLQQGGFIIVVSSFFEFLIAGITKLRICFDAGSIPPSI